MFHGNKSVPAFVHGLYKAEIEKKLFAQLKKSVEFDVLGLSEFSTKRFTHVSAVFNLKKLEGKYLPFS